MITVVTPCQAASWAHLGPLSALRPRQSLEQKYHAGGRERGESKVAEGAWTYMGGSPGVGRQDWCVTCDIQAPADWSCRSLRPALTATSLGASLSPSLPLHPSPPSPLLAPPHRS